MHQDIPLNIGAPSVVQQDKEKPQPALKDEDEEPKYEKPAQTISSAPEQKESIRKPNSYSLSEISTNFKTMEKEAAKEPVLPTVGQFTIDEQQQEEFLLSRLQSKIKEEEAAAVPVALVAPSATMSAREYKLKQSQSLSSVESIPKEEDQDDVCLSHKESSQPHLAPTGVSQRPIT